MSRLLTLVLGPELFWILIYLLVSMLASMNAPPSKSLDNTLLNLAYLVPFLIIPLAFALGSIPLVEKKWFLLRVVLASLFGAHWVLDKGLGAHSEQGPGIGTAYMMGMMYAIVVIAVASVVRLIFR